jgi:hypothetical protein
MPIKGSFFDMAHDGPGKLPDAAPMPGFGRIKRCGRIR